LFVRYDPQSFAGEKTEHNDSNAEEGAAAHKLITVGQTQSQ
jgi:hypothetical protein